MSETSWLIYSRQHNAWWRAGKSGYTVDMREAGRYSFAEAQEIVVDATCGGMLSLPDGGPHEFMVPDPECVFDGAVEPGEDEIATGDHRHFLEVAPSDTERSEWPDQTRAYVESLEEALERADELIAKLVAERDELRRHLKEASDDLIRRGNLLSKEHFQDRAQAAEAEAARLRGALEESDWHSPRKSPGCYSSVATRVLVKLERIDNPPALNAPPKYGFGHRIVPDHPSSHHPKDGWFFDGQDDQYRVVAWRYIEPPETARAALEQKEPRDG